MKYEKTHFPTEKPKLFKTDNEYCIEIGTYLPIAKRVEDLKKAGIDLMAYRQAYAEFANGTQNIDLDDYDNELMNIDEIDFMEKKKRYFDIMKKQAEIAKENEEKMKKKQHDEMIEAEIKKRMEAKKDENPKNA